MVVDGQYDIADLYGFWGNVGRGIQRGAGAVARAPVKLVTTTAKTVAAAPRVITRAASALPSVAAKTGAFVGRTAIGAAALPLTTAISLTRAAGETLGQRVVAPLVKAPFQIVGGTVKAIFKPGSQPQPTTAQEAAVQLVRAGQVPTEVQPPAISPEVQAAAAQAAAAQMPHPYGGGGGGGAPPPGVETAEQALSAAAAAPPAGFFAGLPMAVKIGVPVLAAGGLYLYFRKRSGGRRTKS